MSTTYSFYFKGNDNKFYPLDSFGGSSNVSQAMDAKFGRSFAYCTRKPITKAELKEVSDFEDAVMIESAIRYETDCIVTRNVKDYSKSSLPVFTPKEFIGLLVNREEG